MKQNRSKTQSQEVLQKVLLSCGTLSSLLYVAMLIFVPMQYEGYNSASQTISELSAIGAPTKALWVPLVVEYSLLAAILK
jgi:putative effector of murein hydrolase